MNDKGVVTYDRNTCKDAYYFYQAHWSEAPMLYIAHRRYTLRSQAVTDVKVYTNQPKAVLYLDGRKVATGRGDGLGRIVFADVRLHEGDNTVRVVSGALSDECVWNLDSSRTEEQVTASERLDGAVD
jgi:beta-galactosidase